MTVKSLSLRGYRNLEDTKIELCEGLNIFIGSNAQGKTNIMEALWLFSACKSFRGSEDNDFIGFDKDFCELKTEYLKNGREMNGRILIERGKRKELYKNDAKVRASEMVGNLYSVLFYPEQLSVVKGSPDKRRKFLDFAISQIRPRYLEALGEYQKILLQKNSLLKSRRSDIMETLDLWDRKAASVGGYISVMRQSFLLKAEESIKRVGFEISDGKEKLETVFKMSGNTDIRGLSAEAAGEKLYELSLSARENELRCGFSCEGSQRDDFDILLNGLPAKSYASQGQQRSCLIALKTAEAEIIYGNTGEYPVLLFDDIFSELDVKRRDYITERLINKQVIVTCCERTGSFSSGEAKLFRVEKGRVFSCT